MGVEKKELSSSEIDSLTTELAMLKSENLKKDSLITESITYFNEIERNLTSIELKEKEIRKDFVNFDDRRPNAKELILVKIKYINDLRLQNARKVFALQQKLDTINVAENGFKEILKRLQLEIKQKDNQMNLLERLLAEKDKEYQLLFANFQTQLALNKIQEEKTENIAKDLNQAFYVIGSEDELKQNQVLKITKKGFSKRIHLNENLNERYFTKIEMDKTSEILIGSKKATLVTTHAESSYEWLKEGKAMKLKIIDAALFWKVSKYLVILTD